MRQFVKSLQQVLSIQNFGSSGSKLVHALLDGHPNFLTIPSLYMIYFYDFWPEDEEKEINELLDEFLFAHRYWFDPKGYAPWGTHTMGPNRDETVYVEKEVFLGHMNEILGDQEYVNRQFFFQALYVAYALSYGRELAWDEADCYIMVYPHHTSNQKVATALVKDFPSTRFLHCFREPIQTMCSTYKIGSTRWGGFPKGTEAETTALVELSIFLGDQYRAISEPYKIYAYSPILSDYKFSSRGLKLEDLIEQPKEKLTAICEWLCIPWDDALLTPTYNGKMWWNRPESATVTGFSKVPLARKHADILTRFDRYRLDILLAVLKESMKYPTLPFEFSPLKKLLFKLYLFLPLKIELLSVFPSAFSLPKTLEVFRKSLKKLNSKDTDFQIKGMGFKVAFIEIINFFISWFTLKPIKSYIKVRRLMFQCLERHSKKPDIVKII